MRQMLIHQWSLILILMMTLIFTGYGQDETAGDNVRQTEERIKSSGSKWMKNSRKTKKAPKPAVLSNKDFMKKMGKDYDDTSQNYLISNVSVQGDLDFFASLKSNKIKGESLHYELLNEVTGNRLTLKDINDICYRYTQEFVNRDYLLAYIEPVTKDYADGVLVLKVHSAEFGLVRFFHKKKQDPETGKLSDFTGRYYNVSQIRDRISFKEFDSFNYQTFQDSVGKVNTHPDLTLDSTLRVITDPATQKRKVDIDFLVTEESPFHASIRVDNLGTKDTDDWRARATFQYLNLTERFDILTLDVSSAIGDSVLSGAGSYHYPLKPMFTTLKS